MSAGDDDRTLSSIERQQRGRVILTACRGCHRSETYCDAHRWMRDNAPCCGTCSHKGA